MHEELLNYLSRS